MKNSKNSKASQPKHDAKKETSNTSGKDYQHLHDLSRSAEVLKGIATILEWDQETYMPTDAGAIRSEQLKALAGIVHEKKTNKKFASALEKLIDLKTGAITAKGLNPAQKLALKYWRKDYLQNTALPGKFVEEFAELTSQSQCVWREAREQDAFHHFSPFLDKILAMCRKKADLLGYEEHPYDALLDLYEPELTKNNVSKIFAGLKKSIVALLKKIAKKPPTDDSFLFGKFDRDKQFSFAHLILNDMGYDSTKGRLDISAHPFSLAAHPTDSRITTRVHPKSLMQNIFSVLHEGGHALYELGLPIEQYGSPLCEYVSYGMHESQSRFWETLIGKSSSFWKHYYPLLKTHFKGKLDHVPFEKFYKGINKVQPSLIRVGADEVTYPLHIILRFELECALIEGSLSVRDIPEAWNAKMQELLGICPSTNREGCLQDIHWSIGSFGYFPSYSLGDIYASQLFEAFENDHPNWEKRISQGDLSFVKTWLNDAIHKHGRQYNSHELLKKITNKNLSDLPYTHYLKTKHEKLYSLPKEKKGS